MSTKSQRAAHVPFPVHDYSSAVQSAVSWLGDRYLLAAPIAGRDYGRRFPDLGRFGRRTKSLRVS